jgi:hypothetical protein
MIRFLRQSLGHALIKLGVRVLGDAFLEEVATEPEEDAYEDLGVVLPVQLNERALEMVRAGRERAPAKIAEKPKPLVGSLADRAQRQSTFRR